MSCDTVLIMNDVKQFEKAVAHCDSGVAELRWATERRSELAVQARQVGVGGAAIAEAMGVTAPWVYSNIAKPDAVEVNQAKGDVLLTQIEEISQRIVALREDVRGRKLYRNQLARTLNEQGAAAKFLARLVGVETSAVSGWLRTDRDPET